MKQLIPREKKWVSGGAEGIEVNEEIVVLGERLREGGKMGGGGEGVGERETETEKKE